MTEATLPTPDELKTLPLRAMVVYAVRCARRVQPLFGLAREIPHHEKHLAAIEIALTLSEQYCRGELIATAYAVRAAYAVADAAAYAARAAHTVVAAAKAAYAADDAARTVYAAAYFSGHARSGAYAARLAAAYAAATGAAGRAACAAAHFADDAKCAARSDYDCLRALNPGETPSLGSPLDPSESGPLGPLWPDGPPAWFTQRSDGPVGAGQQPERPTVTSP
ncbi:MAG: hypothetical protein NTY19_28935 [Planctomycetota bacterium]|nr:hypothetical protein [Planctomycetota bacterium]